MVIPNKKSQHTQDCIIAGSVESLQKQQKTRPDPFPALPLLLIVYSACEAIDGAIKLYNVYKLAEAVENRDEEAILRYGGEIVADTAIGAAPLSAVFTKLGLGKVSVMIAGLGKKVDNTAKIMAKADLPSISFVNKQIQKKSNMPAIFASRWIIVKLML